MDRQLLLDYAIYCHGEVSRIYGMIRNNISVPYSHYEGNYITILDDSYPACLKELKMPPVVLFYKGDISLLKGDMLAVVGSRKASSYGLNITAEICSILREKATLVSGLAMGIDGAVHRSCIPFYKTIGVSGCGIDRIYPSVNRQLYQEMALTQLIISEYPAQEKPLRYHFPIRNRIIAALGKALIVTEANMKSGTFLTVNEALDLNREIYAVPHRMDMEKISGTNYLIQQGAEVLNDEEDVRKILKLFDK